MSSTAPLDDSDYEAIEEAVMETARGRWFLTEYARRNRASDTSALFNALHKIERSFSHRPPAEGGLAAADVSLLLNAIEANERELSAIPDDGNDVEIAPDLLETLNRSARRTAADLAAMAHEVQGIAKEMRGDIADTSPLDTLASRLFDQACRHDAVAQRMGATLNLVRLIHDKLNEARGPVNVEAGTRTPAAKDPDLSEDNLRFFSGDEDLFTDVALPKAEAASAPVVEHPKATSDLKIAPDAARTVSLASLAPPATAKGRIIVIRRPSSETAIPLADEAEAPQPAA